MHRNAAAKGALQHVHSRQERALQGGGRFAQGFRDARRIRSAIIAKATRRYVPGPVIISGSLLHLQRHKQRRRHPESSKWPCCHGAAIKASWRLHTCTPVGDVDAAGNCKIEIVEVQDIHSAYMSEPIFATKTAALRWLYAICIAIA